MTSSLQLLIQSGNPLISIETSDEERALSVVRDAATSIPRPLFEWSITSGLKPFEEGVLGRAVTKPGKVVPSLTHVLKLQERAVYLFHDLGPHCKDAIVHRLLRDLTRSNNPNRPTIILVDSLALPVEIRQFTVQYDIGWPSTDELEKVVRKTFLSIRDESYYEITSNIRKSEMESLVQSLRGLSCAEAERVVASAILNDHSLNTEDLPRIVDAKRTILGSTGCLEAIGADVSADDIGGLDNLKEWLKQRRGGFSQKARDFGLESPRGVLMLGVPGCGKSLCAKVVANDWNMPLLRLDPGVLFQKFIGESESQLRRALSQAESMAPVVLWIDEIEKAFASASASSADGGLSKRMFGTLLSWMQDHRHPIFIIATANDISSLPPELMRKGRFDEIFFVDLPTHPSRKQILKIHLERRKRNPADFDLAALADRATGFTGSELEQIVVSALFAAFSKDEELTNEHLLSEIQKTRPLSILMEEEISELRSWAEDRCVPAD